MLSKTVSVLKVDIEYCFFVKNLLSRIQYCNYLLIFIENVFHGEHHGIHDDTGFRSLESFGNIPPKRKRGQMR